tara:strand:+ start:112 stop:333 length:222 start_codon:yes stop_codon:yes gene_type:complete
MPNTLQHLKFSKQSPSNRWIVKYHADGLVREVKLIFNPKEYKALNNSKRLLTRKSLIKVLDKDKAKRQEIKVS